MSTKTRSLNLGFLPALSLVASAFTSLPKTDTRHADAGFNIMLNSNDGDPTATPGAGTATDLDKDAKPADTIVDNKLPEGGQLQQDQANETGKVQQQGNPDAGAATQTAARTETGGQDDNAGGERQTA